MPPDLHRNRDPPRRGQPERGQMPRHVRPQRRNPSPVGVHGSRLVGRYVHREQAPTLRSSPPNPRRTRLLAPATHCPSLHQALEGGQLGSEVVGRSGFFGRWWGLKVVN